MNKYPNLDCQLYFLFRTHLWRDGELIQESFKGRFDWLHQNGVKIDEDKRLFRRNFDSKIQTEGLQNYQLFREWSGADFPKQLKAAYQLFRSFRSADFPKPSTNLIALP